MNGEELKQYRNKLRINISQFARELGVARETIYSWESGRVVISKSRELAILSVIQQHVKLK